MKRLFQGVSIFMLGFLIIFLTINTGAAWLIVSKLIHPGCLTPQQYPHLEKPEEHWITTQDGLSIRIWYYKTHNGAVIFSFGGVNGSLGMNSPPIDFLNEAGFGIIQVDSRVCARPPALVTLGASELLDAEAVLKFTENQPEIEPGQLGVIGFSMGGATALRLAARHPEIKVVIRDGGYVDMVDMFKPPSNASFLQKIFQNTVYWLYKFRTGIDPATYSLVEDLKLVSPRPVLLIYGESEVDYGTRQYQVLDEPSALWIVPASSHGKNHLIAPQEYHQRVLDFLDQVFLGR